MTKPAAEHRMVVTQLLGGLGNQLFQYSVGRALAVRNAARLKMDISSFTESQTRVYALRPFRLEADVLSSCEVRALRLGIHKRGLFAKAADRLLARPAMDVIAEKSFRFDPNILTLRMPCYLKGYWQSFKYFASIEATIRQELKVSSPLVGLNGQVADQIRSAVAVSVHVRRGDYVTKPETNNFHGTCDPEYYSAAETLLRSRIGSIVLFVFSDDPDWVRSNIRFVSPFFVVDHNLPTQAHEDLRLMSMCRHHIIANSSFSWWGAWLSQQEGKLVVAPRRWFRDATIDTEDLIPSNWIRL